MAKISFNIKYRPQIESGEYRVENMAGFPVTILDWCYNGCQIIAKTKIKGEVEGELKDYVRAYTQDGGLLVMGEKYDALCIITPEPKLSDSRQKSLRNNQKQEDDWTEDDEKHLKWLCGIIRHTLITYKELSLKEEVELGKWMDKWLNHSPIHQFHWKPSEQEKGALRTAIDILTNERNFPKAAAQLQNILDAFEGKESRKGWKPSEEQMNRLVSIVAALRKDYCDDMADFLASLYNDLKKLM